MLGEQVIADAPLAERVVDTRDDVRLQIGEYQGRKKQAERAETEARKLLISKSRKEECDRIIVNRNRYDLLLDQWRTLHLAEPGLRVAAREKNKAKKQREGVMEHFVPEFGRKVARREEIIAEIATLATRQAR